MTILHMETETVREVANQLNRISDFIRGEMQAAVQTAVGANWIGANRDQFIAEVERISRQVEESSSQVSQLGARVEREVAEWEQMAANLGSDIGGQIGVITPPLPTPVPTPGPGPDGGDPVSPEKVAKEIFDFFENIMKPIDWIGDHAKASKQLHEIFKDLGRIFNQLGETRGYVKQMDGLATLLEGGADAVGAVGDLLSLDEFRRYFNGELTNAEVLNTACNNFPVVKFVPFLGDFITQKLLPHLNDPDGKWRGLVTPAY